VATFQLECEFDIVRRIGWTDDDLGLHIDDVFDRLHQAAGVDGIDAHADLDTGRSTIAMRFEASRDDDPDLQGRTTLSVAIRAAGGAHNGLLPFREEAGLRPERAQWSGLRTPTWNVRQATLTEVPGDDGVE
jgi:hypothetical protein